MPRTLHNLGCWQHCLGPQQKTSVGADSGDLILPV